MLEEAVFFFLPPGVEFSTPEGAEGKILPPESTRVEILPSDLNLFVENSNENRVRSAKG